MGARSIDGCHLRAANRRWLKDEPTAIQVHGDNSGKKPEASPAPPTDTSSTASGNDTAGCQPKPSRPPVYFHDSPRGHGWSHPPHYGGPGYGDQHHGQLPSPSLPPPSNTGDDNTAETAPICDRAGGCLTINGTSGSALDAYLISAAGWRSMMKPFPELLYEFGVSTSAGASVRQAYSDATEAVLVGLPSGNCTLYVCVRVSNSRGAPAGPKACATISIAVNTQATQQQVAYQLEAIGAFTKKQDKDEPPAAAAAAALGMAHRLAAVAAVSKNAQDGTVVRSLATGLLSQLVTASTATNGTDTASSVLSVFDGVSTLWSMAGTDGRAAAVTGVGAIAKKLATQSLAAEDAQPVINLFTQMLDGATDIVLASANGSTTGANGTAAAEAARNLLASVTQTAAALTQGLLNGAPANGTVVRISTARLSAAVQRATAALAAAGITVSLAAPSSAAAASRRLLSASAVSVSLIPTVGSLCAADAACSSAGLGLTVTVMSDTSLLSTALGGSFAPLVANLSDYRAGGAVQVVSPIVRVAAPGLPAAAVGLPSLVLLDVPIDTTAVNVSATRVLVRLQDFGAAPTDPAAGIPASASVTRTLNSAAASAATDLVSGYSNALGDFVVVQYATAGVPTSGGLPSASPAPGAAGPARLPSALLTGALAGVATLALALMA